MATNAYIPLANITLGSSQTTISFSSISQSYRDLRLVFKGVTTPTSAGFIGQFNADSGSNYSVVTMYGAGSGTPSSTSETWTSNQYSYFAQISTTTPSNITIDIMDYSATDKHKSWLSRNSSAELGVEALAGRWASTSAITAMTFTASGTDQFAAGSTFSLYGISA